MRINLDGLEVFFPYPAVYREQYMYMLEVKRALDAKGDGLLEMPTGTVPEMTKAVEELKRVISYRNAELEKDMSASAADPMKGTKKNNPEILAVCLSSRRNLCIHPDVIDASDREEVDAACRSMTASWVRQRAEADSSIKTCDFFENYDKLGTDADLKGIYNLDDLKRLGQERGWCPYFLTRHVISYANVVVYNYQYMLDPKIATMVSREMEDKSIVVFDEAHNIDNICIEALSVTLDRRLIDGAVRNLNQLESDVKRMRQADAARLQDEYARLVHGLSDGGGLGVGAASAGTAAATATARGGEELPAAPVLPQDVLQEAVPGNIRNAELFVRFMKHIVRYLRDKIKVASVVSETPTRMLHDMSSALAIDIKPLKFAYSRLNSLLRTLQITNVDEFTPIQLIADFTTLLATYPVGFMVISEPYNAKTPHIPDPIMQLACLDASLAIKPVFQKFQSVILTSGTLSPLDMYPKMLNFNPVVRVSLEMSIVRPCICPMIVSRGGDQTPMTTKFELRDDRGVLRNYGMLLVQLCATVPDGIVAFFPSYAYMEKVIAAWHTMGVLKQMEAHKLIFFETKDIVETTLSLNNFKRACDVGRGALFFSIARGKVAEGIDFDRHYGRCVVIFGIPFQYTLSHVLRARLLYLKDTFNIREQDFLTFDALRQSSQCVGRVIRSKRDYGIIVFADKRYASHDKRSKLPQWVLQFLPDAHVNLSTDMSVMLSRKFLKEMAQPLPEGIDLGKTLLTESDVIKLQMETGLGAAPSARPTMDPLRASRVGIAPGTVHGLTHRERDAAGVDNLDGALADAMGLTVPELRELQAVESAFSYKPDGIHDMVPDISIVPGDNLLAGMIERTAAFADDATLTAASIRPQGMTGAGFLHSIPVSGVKRPRDESDGPEPPQT